MILKSVQTKLFRNVLDSTEVEIQPDVTCLVGKNESGKTAFLEALRRLHPAQGNESFNIGRHYPAWLEKRHRLEGKDLDDVRPIRATFELEEKDKEQFAGRFGEGVLTSDEITVARAYGGTRYYGYQVDEAQAVKNVISEAGLPSEVGVQANKISEFDALVQLANDLSENSEDDEQKTEAGEALQSIIAEFLGDHTSLSGAAINEISSLVPEFFYFSQYSTLPGIVKIRELLSKDDEELDEDERTARSLLELAAAEDEYLLNPDYETRKRELENVANAITDDVLKYWTTNTELRVQIDITQKTEQRQNGQYAVVDELHVRMYDNRHLLSLPFGERSSGFQWFFSFLAAFSRYEHDDSPVIILLDEPGLGLHARAQKDFLRFIDERLAQRCQVIYTTHSPFMVQSGNLERARVVEDKGRENGAVVTSDILTTDPDTLFPLQGALGYDIAQHLLITQNNVVVEGTSDFVYLNTLSDHLEELGRTTLDKLWSVQPVGGADLIPTFVALLGMHLDMTVLVDSRKEGHQRLGALAQQGYLSATRIITVGEILGRKLADIEDLFTPGDYLSLYNAAYSKRLKVSDLKGTDTIVRKIARYEGIDRFDHGKPADALLRDKVAILSSLSDTTLANFEKLIQRINSTLGSS